MFTARMLGEEGPFGACDDPAGIVGLARWVAKAGCRAVEIMDRLGLPDGALRVGIVHYNTEDEVIRLLAALAAI